MTHQHVYDKLMPTLVGRLISKRFVANRRLCWFPGIIRKVISGQTGILVSIYFFDGDIKYYTTMLRDKVIVFLPRHRSQFAIDSKQFQHQFYENQTYPHPHPGATIFVNLHNVLIKCHVQGFDVDTRLHRVIRMDTGEVLHLALADIRGPRWFWFCDQDNNCQIPTSLVCTTDQIKQEVMQVVRNGAHFSQYGLSTEFLRTICGLWMGQLYTCPLFLQKCDAGMLRRNFMSDCECIVCLGQLLPEDILRVLLEYVFPVDSLTVYHDVFRQFMCI